jgi:hypothetical protein
MIKHGDPWIHRIPLNEANPIKNSCVASVPLSLSLRLCVCLPAILISRPMSPVDYCGSTSQSVGEVERGKRHNCFYAAGRDCGPDS